MADLKKYGFSLDEDGWIEVTKENCEKINFPRHKLNKIKDILEVNSHERYALAFVLWENKHRLATRWFWSKIGDPNSRGYPTWHILPDSYSKLILDDLKNKNIITDDTHAKYISKLGIK